MKLRSLLMTAMFAVFASQSATAGIINSADVSGLHTFTDTATGRIWLDINNFYNSTATQGTTGLQMIALAQAAGFTFATKADVHELLDTLPLNGTTLSQYEAVMGYSAPRNLIWGMYDDSNGSPYGYAYSSGASWAYSDNATIAANVQNGSNPGAIDLGIWAYRSAQTASVPEPGSIALTALAIAGLLAARRRKV